MSKIGIQTHGVNHKIMRKGLKTGGRAALRFGSGRTNLLEQLGRVEAEPSNPNRRAEISRVHGELNRGYAKGGRAGHAAGSIVKGGAKVAKKILDFVKTGKYIDKHGTKINVPKVVKRLKKQGSPHLETYEESMKAEGGRIGRAAGGWTKIPRTFKKLDFPGDKTGKPHSSREGRRDSWVRGARRAIESAKKIEKKMKPKRPSPQPLAKGGKADKKWIQKAVNPKHKGFCTPMTKKTCTPRRKALARTFKKKAKTGW